ncbi:carcinoembryonic antigen-related cell adhesion molecule 5-like isoform X2 [Gigantopelta aegis]|uniref:carcinoembryonic antigen-related cell adhesion molecule 5-like isoform X2 n=1 Tax=Gigantopelta aegis TaxID=1735272 RepID=UPI001B88B330|nr:carcinoembryonic antigen-related cell adhesion molecule 5-like isoform X2 [Gigantopelta aegis]
MAQGYRYKFCFLLFLIAMIHSATGQFNLTASGPYGIVGSPFTFTCRTDFLPEVTWFVNNTEYTMHGSGRGECYPMSPLPTFYTFNCTYDIFTLTINSVNISQHRTVWRCGEMFGPPESNTIVLEVRGGPGSSLHVNTSSSVSVNERDDVVVSCAADCFLRCDYTWMFNDKTIRNSSILSVSRINRSEIGTYTCTAVNPDTQQAANTTVHVYVQRVAHLTTSGPYGIVGSPFTFTCRTPTPEITWFENNTEYMMYSNGRGECDIDILPHIPRNYNVSCSYGLFTLTINSVNIHQHRTAWRCRGFPWESTSNTIVLEVRDGPGSTVRVNTPSALIPEEGSDVAVSCAADCFLRCVFTWTFNNKTISNSSILSLPGINRTQNGTYSCTAVNPDTRQSVNTSVHVDVLYQPVIKLLQLKKPDTKAVVDEVRPITLICVVDSNPTSSMKLFRDRQLIRQMTNVTSLEYTWREAVCQTSGTYSCEAENSVKSPAKHTLELAVECFPGKKDGRFAAGFGGGIGTAVALLLLCGAVVLLYLRLKKSETRNSSYTVMQLLVIKTRLLDRKLTLHRKLILLYTHRLALQVLRPPMKVLHLITEHKK